MPRTKAAMAQAIGNRADMRIVTCDLKLLCCVRVDMFGKEVEVDQD